MGSSPFAARDATARRFRCLNSPCPRRRRKERSGSPPRVLIGDGYGPRRLPDSVAKVLRTLLEEPAAVKVTATDSLPAVYAPPQNGRAQTPRPIHVYESERTVFLELRSVLKLVHA